MKEVRLRHRVEFALVEAVRAVVRVLPERAVRGLGTMVGLFFYVCDPPHRRLAIKQLRAAFPTRPAAECQAIARATFAHFGRLLVLLLKFSTLSLDEMRARIDVEGDDHMRAALAVGKGVIIVTGHFGFWEIQGIGHALVLPPIALMARPLDNPLLHDLLERIRRATGNQVIYRQGGVRRVLRALSANQGVAMLIDQHVHGADAIRVDFFNRPVATTSALASLALRTGAPIVPAFALPIAHGRFKLIYEHPIELPFAGSADPVKELTQRCTDVLEMYVRRYPHLWLWMHRRWRESDDDGAVAGMFPTAVSDDRGEPVES